MRTAGDSGCRSYNTTAGVTARALFPCALFCSGGMDRGRERQWPSGGDCQDAISDFGCQLNVPRPSNTCQAKAVRRSRRDAPRSRTVSVTARLRLAGQRVFARRHFRQTVSTFSTSPADELTHSHGPLRFGFSVSGFFASTSYCERQAGHSRTDRVPSTDTTFFRPGD